MGMEDEMDRSKRTAFCPSCHIIEPYGKSLLIDDSSCLGAAHSQNHLRAAGVLIIIGLIVEALCSLRSRPLDFVGLVCTGGLLTVAGVAAFLFSLASPQPSLAIDLYSETLAATPQRGPVTIRSFARAFRWSSAAILIIVDSFLTDSTYVFAEWQSWLGNYSCKSQIIEQRHEIERSCAGCPLLS